MLKILRGAPKRALVNSRSPALAVLITLGLPAACSEDAPKPTPIGGTSDLTDGAVSGMTDASSGGDGDTSTGDPVDTMEPESTGDATTAALEGSSTSEEPSATDTEPESGASTGEESGSGSGESASTEGDPSETTATNAVCGDGLVEGNEECDDANEDDLDACHDDCTFHRVTELALGGNHTCARFDSGRVMCWGYGAGGRTGHGHTANIGDDEPASAGGFLDLGGEVERVVAGVSHTCVIHPDGDVRCFGAATVGQLGRGNLTPIGDNETPGSRSALQLGASALAIGTGGGAYHTCASLSTNAVKCWGQHAQFQLGIPGLTQPIGDDETVASAPEVVVGGLPVAFTGGAHHTCALFDGGGVRCWGTASTGALGYANTNAIGDDEDPAWAGEVLVGGDVIDLTAGWYHTCAVVEGGDVHCWGRGNDGRLGYGNTAYVGLTNAPEDVGAVPLSGPAREVAAGVAHTCALLESGEVQCWGWGGQGQLGYGNTASVGDNETPASVGVVDVGAPVVHIDADGNHTCVVTDVGSVRCWGNAGEGRLGYGNLSFIGDDETPASVGDVPLF